jgi:hypothetical protein
VPRCQCPGQEQHVGDYAGAIASYERALMVELNHPDAHEVRDKLLASVL